MNNILDRFSPRLSAFRPKNVRDLLALRLAQKLNDADAAEHYSELANRHSESELLTAFRRAVRSGGQFNLGRRFHEELRHSSANDSNGRHSQCAAIRMERRAVAVAIFSGDQLAYTQVRQLSSARDKAVASAVGFVNWVAEQFRLDSATIESIPTGDEIQRQVLNQAAISALRQHLLPIWEVTKQDLFLAYGFPALKSRKELRQVVTGIWPILAGSNGKAFIQDAAALGLYVQIERNFLN